MRPPARKKRTARAKKRSGAPAKKKPAGRAPGVIDSLVQYLEAGGGTLDQLVAKLARKFPKRDPEAMRKTLPCQLGPRLHRERKVKVRRHEGAGKAARSSA